MLPPAEARRIYVRAFMDAWESYNGLVGLERLFPTAHERQRTLASERAHRRAEALYRDAPPPRPTDAPRG